MLLFEEDVKLNNELEIEYSEYFNDFWKQKHCVKLHGNGNLCGLQEIRLFF